MIDIAKQLIGSLGVAPPLSGRTPANATASAARRTQGAARSGDGVEVTLSPEARAHLAARALAAPAPVTAKVVAAPTPALGGTLNLLV